MVPNNYSRKDCDKDKRAKLMNELHDLVQGKIKSVSVLLFFFICLDFTTFPRMLTG